MPVIVQMLVIAWEVIVQHHFIMPVIFAGIISLVMHVIQPVTSFLLDVWEQVIALILLPVFAGKRLVSVHLGCSNILKYE